MQLTQFTDLGLRITLLLAGEARPLRASTRAIAQALDASYAHTAKVTSRLADLGVVQTFRGRAGGAAITDQGRSATIGWLVRQLEGDAELVPSAAHSPRPTLSGNLHFAVSQAKQAMFDELDSLTVEQLAQMHR